MKCVVCDTGPLIHLEEAGVRNLLSHAGAIHIPQGVEAEMRRHEERWLDRRPAWLKVTNLNPHYDVEARTWQQAGLLDEGEAEAVALARQLNAHWLLTDDTAARLVGQAFGLDVHGSLGVVPWAAATNRLRRDKAESALDRLAQSSLWVSSSVLLTAKAALEEMFP